MRIDERGFNFSRHESRAFKTGWVIGSASRIKIERDQKPDTTLGSLQKARRLMVALPGIIGAEGAPSEAAVVIADPDLVDPGSDSGKHVFSKLVDVPTGKVVTVGFKYVTPGGGSILIQKQPGQVNLDVNLIFREGSSIKKKQKVKLSGKARLNY